MVDDKEMVKKERSGKVGFISGKKADEFTERYGYIPSGVISAEEILHGKTCSPERIANIRTAQLALNDMTASKVKETLQNRFKNAIETCEENEEGACELYTKSNSKKWKK